MFSGTRLYKKAGVVYDAAFAWVALNMSIRTVLAVTNKYNLEAHPMDVQSTFLLFNKDWTLT